MGRASKWIRNLLAGKKEEKNLKGSSSGRSSNNSSKYYCAENLMLAASILPEESPKVKARWSFSSRSSTSSSAAAAEPSHYLKISTSFDSSVSTNQQLKTTAASLKYQTFRQISSTTELSVPTQLKTTPQNPIFLSLLLVLLLDCNGWDHQARRALLALRGLVKLQALVRGHLVRKRTTATMRCINALITIQVRARVQRIQMAKEEESTLLLKRQSTSTRREQHQALNRHQRAPYDEQRMVTDDMKITVINNSNTNPSRNLSFLRRDQCLPASSPNPLKTLEYPLTASHTIPRYTSRDTEIFPMEAHHFAPILEFTNQISHNCTWLPNYMANTEASKAKLRSHSEPKRQPKNSDKQTTRRSTSSEEIGIAQKDFRVLRQLSDVRPNTQKNQWLNKLPRPTRKSIKDNQGDANSKTGKSNNCGDLIRYDQPPVNLY